MHLTPALGTHVRRAPPRHAGFNVETVTYKNIKFQVWDLGGQTSIRPYWRCYFPCTQVRAAQVHPRPRSGWCKGGLHRQAGLLGPPLTTGSRVQEAKGEEAGQQLLVMLAICS